MRYFNAAGADPNGDHGEDHRPETHLLPRAIAAALGLGPPLPVNGLDWDTPDGSCVRDFVHVEDLARAHQLALQRLWAGGDSGAFHLGSGRGSSVREVLAAVEQELGRRVPWHAGPRRPGDPAALVADPAAAAAALGWRPHHGLAEIVASAVRWHTRHPRGYTS